jgi:Ulp1 family protease
MGERAGMLYYAGAQFYTKLKESFSTFSRNEYKNVKRWIKVDILGGSYSSFLFPIRQPSPNHWYLVVFIQPHIVFGEEMNDGEEEQEEPCVLILDSITENNRHHDEVVTSLKSYFVEKWLDDKVEGTEEQERLRKLYNDKFDKVEPLILQCPSQGNMYDCGGFTCKNAANIIVSRPSYKSKILVDYEGKSINWNNYAQKDVTAYRESVMTELAKRIASKL